LFAQARFNTEIATRAVASSLRVAAVPGPAGRALGASGGTVSSLALGPAYDDEAVKRVLDNCRLDYLYEPDWPRQLARVSRMLGSGKVVAWVQGPMAFGPRALGTRSILADPSQRYARQNVNEYLRGRPADDPLPVAFAPSRAASCLDGDVAGGARDVALRAESRAIFAPALDARHRARVHSSPADLEPRLRDLLEYHASASGTPGLIELNLASPGEPTACTPRETVRSVFSSAIDALVIGRFLLMKDYWLLRSGD
jgi:carbamoyltransferase